MNCKVCQHDLDDHIPYQLQTCLGYLKKEIEKIEYGMERLSGMEEEDEDTTTKITQDTYNILGIGYGMDDIVNEL